jgi:hypothetical protein
MSLTRNFPPRIGTILDLQEKVVKQVRIYPLIPDTHG